MCCLHVLPLYVATGDIGGLMGIFLGASLLSLVELLEFFLLLLQPRNKLKTVEEPPVQKGTMLLQRKEAMTRRNPVQQQQTGKGSKKVGNKKIYTSQRKF
jgi:hypothetical protein